MRYELLALVGPVVLSACLSEAPKGVAVGSAHQIVVAMNSIDTARVSVEFAMYANQVEEYPVLTEGFLNALSQWSCSIPIKPTVFVQDKEGYDFVHYRYGVIEVCLADLQDPAYGCSEGIVGLWEQSRTRLLLDVDYLESHPDRAFAVSLHELGHVFGLPHVVNHDEPGMTGMLVLEEGQNANSYVMYPETNDKYPQSILSQLEITLAAQQVMLSMTNPSFVRIAECHLTSD